MADLSTASTGSAQTLHDALEYAREAHRGQRRRQNGRPFIEHPVAVAELLATEDQPDAVLAAGYLHEVVHFAVGPAHFHDLFGNLLAGNMTVQSNRIIQITNLDVQRVVVEGLYKSHCNCFLTANYEMICKLPC